MFEYCSFSLATQLSSYTGLVSKRVRNVLTGSTVVLKVNNMRVSGRLNSGFREATENGIVLAQIMKIMCRGLRV